MAIKTEATCLTSSTDSSTLEPRWYHHLQPTSVHLLLWHTEQLAKPFPCSDMSQDENPLPSLGWGSW
jgi:hypothetical protein